MKEKIKRIESTEMRMLKMDGEQILKDKIKERINSRNSWELKNQFIKNNA